MTISELIKELERAKERLGDVAVIVDQDGRDEVASEVVPHTIDNSEQPNAVIIW